MTWFITHFEPLQEFLTNYLSILQIKKVNKSLFYILNLIYNIISCHKCLVFWSTLLITFNIWFAIYLSLMAYTLTKINK